MTTDRTLKIVIIFALTSAIVLTVALKNKKEHTNTDTSAQNVTEQAATSNNIEKASKLPKLIDLGADKCIPCKMMAPILEEIKDEYKGRLDVEFIDVWKYPDKAKKYNIKLIPTQIFYDSSGKELFRHEGFFSKEAILSKWKEFEIDLVPSEK